MSELILMSFIIITLGIVKIHTYPGKIARERKHPQQQAIEVTSLLGLLIFPLWMFALVWAYSNAIIGQLYTSKAEDDVEPADDSNRDDDSPEQLGT